MKWDWKTELMLYCVFMASYLVLAALVILGICAKWGPCVS